MNNLKLAQKAFKRLSRMPLASLNYHLGNYGKVIWIVSDGRSGSTWLSDLINWDRRYRELFEPFHPYIVKRVKDFSLFEYLRPHDTESELGDFLKCVFSGKFKHLRADVSQPRLFYKGLLVKDIFANLLLPWAVNNIPQVKKILLIRNPFAVALSKQKLKKWTWLTEPTDLLRQEYLLQDYLAPFENLIHSVSDDFIEKQILIWAIIHYVPLSTLNDKEIYVIFYEDLVSQPVIELEKLFLYLGRIDTDELEQIERIKKPTRTTKTSSISQRREINYDSWKQELSSKQIDRGVKFLEHFNLDGIYKDGSLPDRASLKNIICTRKANEIFPYHV